MKVEDAVLAATAVKRILVPVDFSERSDEAVRHARAFADLYDAEVDLLHVIDATFVPDVYGVGLLWYEAMPEVIERCRAALAETAEDRLGARAGEILVEVGSPAVTVLAAAERTGTDLIVMATHGRTGLKRLALGSVAERVVQHAARPVLVVKSFGKSLLAPPEAAARPATTTA